MSGWAGALRAARRTARRTPGRTALVLTLIALPVTVVVAGETLARTASISVRESLPQVLGASDAQITSEGGVEVVKQDPLLKNRACECDSRKAQTEAQVLSRLPQGSTLLPVVDSDVVVTYPDGALRSRVREVDLRDPMAKGLFTLRSGRLPANGSEVVVTPRVASRGFPVGSTLTAGTLRPIVVGVVDPPALEGKDAPFVVGLPSSLSADRPTSWLAHVPGGLSWNQVRELNGKGLFVLSRKVVDDPPPASQVSLDVQSGNSGERTLITLVAVLAVLQVVLLAAPAFAVGARRQRRVLAMIGAVGGEPRHVRRFVLAQGVVLGGAAGLLGAGLGVVSGMALRPVLAVVDTTPGPLEISWRDTALTALVGAVAALLAALVPALVAGRQDVLAGLTGRRGTTTRSLRTLIPGLVILGIGVFGCIRAAAPGARTFAIVWAALPMVLGAALLAPTVIVLLARAVGRLPFSLRFALRDAARSRGRTAAAAAAVTATVAGAVSLGIGGASDSLQGRSTYRPSGPQHAVVIGGLSTATPSQHRKAVAVVKRRLPAWEPETIRSLVLQDQLTVEDGGTPDLHLVGSYGGVIDGSALVGESALDLLGLTPAQRARAVAELQANGAVVLVDEPSSGDVDLVVRDMDGKLRTSVRVAAYRVAAPLHPTQVVLSAQVARRLGAVVPSGLLVQGDVSSSAEDQLNEELAAAGAGYATVERGYQASRDQRIALVVVGITAALLVLGGTLSASLLALSDARPDFSTLMAVGASPRLRRRVAASYAAVIGLLGALLGTMAGFAPGIAVSYPLTRGNDVGFPDHYLAVPWLLVLGLALGVPMLAAGGAALLTRSRLPLAGRVET